MFLLDKSAISNKQRFAAFCFRHSHPRVRERKKTSVKEQDYQVSIVAVDVVVVIITTINSITTIAIIPLTSFPFSAS